MDREQSELIEGEVIVNNDVTDFSPTVSKTPLPARHTQPGVDLRTASPDAIRADIERTRSAMDTTIDQLNARLKPRHLLDQVLNAFQSGSETQDAGPAQRTIREAGVMAADKLKQNPVPATLIGAGLAWMLFRDNRTTSTRTTSNVPQPSYDPYLGSSSTEPGYVNAGSHSAGLADRAKDTAADLKDKAADAIHGARSAASTAADRTQTAAHSAKNALSDLVESAPLALGIGALAAGLLTGLLLPGTRAEDELMGDTSDQLKDSARDLGNTVKEEAQSEGLLSAQGAGKLDRMWDR